MAPLTLPALRLLALNVLRPVLSLVGRRPPTVAEQYVTSLPSAQNALDTFKGEWFSRFPEPFSSLAAGETLLFEDPRIAWAISEFGDVRGHTVLELGPLEGGHTYMLEQAGFGSVTSIEANPRAYLKCLVTKELLQLHRSRFLCGDFVEYLRNSPPSFHAVVACGVLYHMTEPAELLTLLSQVTDRLFIWTHYHDAQKLKQNEDLAARVTGESQVEYRGFKHTVTRYQYWNNVRLKQFLGGPGSFANWMTREDITTYLRQLGYSTILVAHETPDHMNGPAFALVAFRG